MRLHSLHLTGVGPFKATQEIDFDELTSSGLFLIEGPTGSGKTTIIDALVYALFGVVSGGSDDVTRMRIRSSYCDETDPTGVACEFSVDGRRHRITRIPAGCRDPEEPTRKAGSKGPRQVLTELDEDGEPLAAPLAVRKEVDQRIEELLGMSAEQFRQLVVLPQGQFAELLRKTPAERLASLAPLLEDTFIARVQDDLRQQGEQAMDLRTAAALEVDHAAHRLAGRLEAEVAASTDGESSDDSVVDFTDSQAPPDARRATVEQLMREIAEEAARSAHARQTQDLIAQSLRDAAAASAGVLSTLISVGEARARVADARGALDLDDRDLADAQVGSLISDLRRTEGSLEALAAWEAKAETRAQQRTLLEQTRADHAERAEHLKAEQSGVPQRRAELETRREQATVTSARLAACQAAVAEADRLLESARLLDDRQAALAARAAELEHARAQERETASAAEEAQQVWESLVAAHRSGSAADLAEVLVPGEPCPVCGSGDHPHPAQPLTTDVTRADLDAAAEQASTARTASATAAQRATAAQVLLAEAATAAALVEGVVAGRTVDDLVLQHQLAVEAEQQAQTAADLLALLQDELTDLNEREAALQAGILESETAAATAAATLAAAELAEHEGQLQIAAAIGDATSATALLARTRSRIGSLTALNDATAQLAELLTAIPADQRSLSVEDAESRATQDEAAYVEAAGVLATLTDRAAALASTEEEATPLARAFVTAMDAHALVVEGTAPAVSLAALVTAGNSRRLQLRAYALQRRFDSVLAAATIQLEHMSQGKFSFVSTDEAARGQAGLGIQLLDAWTGHLQDPRSLSGGETFYASLALALGLAEVVRSEAGGAQLETLFVDEGFGSLDQDTLYQVLEQLDRLRAGNRAVGVVSHVTEMKESIPDRIEVRRLADRTSTIVRAS